MSRHTYDFDVDGVNHQLEMIPVEGTGDEPYLFGTGDAFQQIKIKDFFMSRYQITQAVWKYVMNGADPAHFKGDLNPVENVSFEDITGKDGFLDQLNRMELPGANKFRLPTESEWEYAARGGKHWKDNFEFSGSNEIESVAWYLDNSGRRTHAVGEKAPNQIGIYDMCGNVWEWCEDLMVRDTGQIPKDGSPYLASGTDRILRGGCHHNGAIHCTVSKRYEIFPRAADECIGFRLACSRVRVSTTG